MHSKEDASGVTSAPARTPSPGQMLRAAREAKGLHLAVLSVALKVPTRQLEALENDQHNAFKGIIFVRALAQAMCRHLGVDPAPVLAALPKTSSPLSASPRPAPSVVSSGVPRWRRAGAHGKGVSRWVLWLAALMLVGAAVLIWWPQTPSDEPTPAVQGQDVAPMPELQEQASEPAEVPASAAQTAPAPAAEVKPQAQVPVPVPPVPVVPAARPAPLPGAATATDAPLLIRASADAWVSVRDSQGQIVLNRKVKSGESVKLDLAAPLFVYAGRPDGIELAWRGQAVDLKPHTQNNEIRLLIKP